MTLSEDPERQMDLLTPPHADPLDETLAAISVRSSVYCLSELTAPWGFRVRHAAELLTQQPGRPWTLPSLAHEVGMSRSLLAARFRAAMGQSPMRHLASIRLGQAAGYLTTSDLSLDAIAIRTGYGSNASLSKAFKREFGISPGTYRRLKGDAAVLKVR